MLIVFSPPHGATLLVVDLDELPKATGIVVVRGLGVSKGLKIKKKTHSHLQLDTSEVNNWQLNQRNTASFHPACIQ